MKNKALIVGIASASIAVAIETFVLKVNDLNIQNILINFLSSTIAAWIVMRWRK